MEVLEESKAPEPTHEKPKKNHWLASQSQIDYIKSLGGIPRKNMTKKQAAELIDDLKTKTKQTIPIQEIDLNNLTKEEIEKLEEEGALL